MMECSRMTGSHCAEHLTPSSDISSCNVPTAITANYKQTHRTHTLLTRLANDDLGLVLGSKIVSV